MKIYTVKEEYIKFLSCFDSRVSMNKKEKRPYVGIVLQIDEIKYYAPLTSPKPKHRKMKNAVDFRKIGGGIYGAINFNNMIPVTDSEIYLKIIENETDMKYRELLKNQLRHLQRDGYAICATAYKLHAMCMKEDSSLTEHERAIKLRCCDFSLLEKHYKEYSVKMQS